MNTIRKLVLFDIDGTLVLTGGAGIRAMNRACEELVGHPHALEGIPVAGRTDRIILTDVVTRAGHDLHDGLLEQLRDRYIANLRAEIERPGRLQSFESLGARGGIKSVMPGIRELLGILEQRDDVFLGLLTGNFKEGARIKLEHFDLWRYFRCGAFGDAAPDRNGLLPRAVSTVAACGGPAFAATDAVVIGDTPLDIACAKFSLARSIGVATGMHSVDELRSAGADVVFADLSDTRSVLRALNVLP